MTRKVVSIDPRPRRSQRDRQAGSTDQWVKGGSGQLKRFTIELEEGLHRRLRMMAAREGRSMADIVRELLEDACPE